MRLFNLLTEKLDYVPDPRGLKYAILSHRWGPDNDELTFQDIIDGAGSEKGGYKKLKHCCDRAKEDTMDYVWIDTCCIDKSSSAELSESLNSMYVWYEKATICYAYLSDVLEDTDFEKSNWFSRGWTLQELIAPSKMRFYNCKWSELGTKQELSHRIRKITGIDEGVLAHGDNPQTLSIAKRMSWASKRETKRVEDVAYSLLGLFGVSMPMLYGEGGTAFIRLQEEILKRSDDHSLFAWSGSNRGLLARSPADFVTGSNIISSNTRLNRIPYSVTNMGLSIELPLVPWAMDKYLAALDCVREESDDRIGIFLELLPENGQYARTTVDGTSVRAFEADLIAKSEYRKIYVRQSNWRSSQNKSWVYGFCLRQLPGVDGRWEDSDWQIRQWRSCKTYEQNRFSDFDVWGGKDHVLEIPAGQQGPAGLLWCKQKTGNYYAVLELGFDTMFNPTCRYGLSRLQPNNKSFDIHWYCGTHSTFKGTRAMGLKENSIVIGEGKVDGGHDAAEENKSPSIWVVEISAL